MKKRLLSGLLLVGSFLVFNNHLSAAELSTSTDQPLESTENIIYFNSDTQDILVTDDIIITTVEPINSVLEGPDVQPLTNGVWDPLGSETVYAESSVYSSDGGSFWVSVSQTDYGPVFYQLKEQDPYVNDNVGNTISVSGSKSVNLTYRNISVDGDNNRAELYMKKLSHTGKGYLMSFYD